MVAIRTGGRRPRVAARARGPGRRHRPAPDLQRALRGAAASSTPSRGSTIRPTASRSRSSTIRPTRPPPSSRTASRSWRAQGVDDRARPARESRPASRRARSRTALTTRARRTASRSSTPTSCRRPDFLRRTRADARGRLAASRSSRRAGATSTGTGPLLTRLQALSIDGHFAVEQAGRWGGGPVVQLQRHGRDLAPRGARRRGRLAARHADRGPGHLVPGVPARLARSLPPRRRRPGGAAGQLQRLPAPAAPLGAGQLRVRLQASAHDLAARRCRCRARSQATLHLTGYSIHLLLLALSLLYPLLLVLSVRYPVVLSLFGIMAIFNLTTLAPSLLFTIGQRQLGRRWRCRDPNDAAAERARRRDDREHGPSGVAGARGPTRRLRANAKVRGRAPPGELVPPALPARHRPHRHRGGRAGGAERGDLHHGDSRRARGRSPSTPRSSRSASAARSRSPSARRCAGPSPHASRRSGG